MTAKDNPMILRPDLVLLPLDDDAVVFSEAAQRLVGLNATAAFIFAALQAGQPSATVAQSLVDSGRARGHEAPHWVNDTIDALATHGMLADGLVAATPPAAPTIGAGRVAVPPFAPAAVVAERRYRLLGTTMLIRFGHLAQRRLVDAVIGHLAIGDGPPPEHVMDIQGEVFDLNQIRSHIYLDGAAIGHAQRLSFLGPRVKAALWLSAVNAHDFLMFIHAGVVGTDRGCILLPAAPGSGKSSLTMALTHRGYRYYSDEVALIETHGFRVPPVPLAICVKHTGWDLMARYCPEIMTLPVHRREDRKVVRYIPPPVAAAGYPRACVNHIIFPKYVAGAENNLKPMPRAVALGRLMDQCMALRRRLDRDIAVELVLWIAGISCHELIFSSLDAAGELIGRELAQSPNSIRQYR